MIMGELKRDKDNYIEWIDYAKGIGIILVVIGHAIRDEMRINSVIYDYLYTIIYFFHMPLFFFVSGYLFERSSLSGLSKSVLLKKKICSILMPFIFYSVFIFIVFYIASNLPIISSKLENMGVWCISVSKYLLLMIQGNNPYAFHMWFLLVLFIIEIFNLFFNNEVGKLGLLLPEIILYFLSHIIPSLTLYTTVNEICKMAVFFTAGRIYYTCENKIKYPISIIALSFSVGLGAETVKYFIVDNVDLFFRIVLLACKFLTIYSIIGISKKIHYKNLAYLGRKSMCVYLFHQPFCCAFLGTILYNKLKLYSLFVICICTCLSFIIPHIIVYTYKYKLNKFRLLE